MAARKNVFAGAARKAREGRSAQRAAAEQAAHHGRADEVQKELEATAGKVSGLTSRAGILETSVETAERTMQDVGDKPATLKSQVETAEATMKEVGDKPATLKGQVETVERTMEDVGDRPATVKSQVEAAEATMEEVGDKPETLKGQVEAAESTMQEVGDRPATLKTDLETAEATMQEVGNKPATVKSQVEAVEGMLPKKQRMKDLKSGLKDAEDLVGDGTRIPNLKTSVEQAEGLADETRIAALRTNIEQAETLMDKLAKPDEEEEEELKVDDPSNPMQVLEAKLKRAFRNAPEVLSLIMELVDRTVTSKVYAAAKAMRDFADPAVRRDEDIGEALEEFLDRSEGKTSVENAAYEDDDAKLLAALASITARHGLEALISHATDLFEETDPNAQEQRRRRSAKLCDTLRNEEWKAAILEGAAREIADELISDDSIYEDQGELESAVRETFSGIDEKVGQNLGRELMDISQNDPDETRRERAGRILEVMRNEGDST